MTEQSFLVSNIPLYAADASAGSKRTQALASIYAGCKILYSEDMQDGQHFGSVKIVNPFASA